MVLGAIGLVLSTLGTIAMWDARPHWSSLVVIASVVPCTWLGAARRVRRLGG